MDNFNPVKSLALFFISLFDFPSDNIKISCVLVSFVLCMIFAILFSNIIMIIFNKVMDNLTFKK